MRISFASAMVLAIGPACGCGDPAEKNVVGVAYAPDGRMIAFLDGEARFFDADTQYELGTLETGNQSDGGWMPFAPRFVLSSDGSRLAVAPGRNVEIYDTRTGQLITSIVVNEDPQERYPIAGIALSADGNLIAASVRPVFSSEPSRLAVWRVADQSVAAEIAHASGRDPASWTWSAGLAFSPDGAVLYGVDQDAMTSYLTAWSTTDGSVLWESAVPAPAWVDVLAVSADGASIATAGLTVNLWRAADGTRQDQLHTDPLPLLLGSVAFSPNAQSLVTTHFSNALPDPEVLGPDGSVVRGFPIENSGCAAAAFSPDGTRIAAACPPWLKIWNADSGAEIRRVKVTAPLY